MKFWAPILPIIVKLGSYFAMPLTFLRGSHSMEHGLAARLREAQLSVHRIS